MVVAKMTSTPLPRMGLGMAALGRPGYITLDRATIFGADDRTVEKMQYQANLVLEELFKECRNADQTPWLDCARSYGLSEQFVGEFLRHRKQDPKSVYVSSKWGYTYVADFKVELDPGAKHEIKDHSTENFFKQVKETKEHLGEYIDLYQIHSATFDSGILTDYRAHEALASCRKELGWAIGLSVSGPEQGHVIREARKIQVRSTDDSYGPLFGSVQCTYNVLEQSPGEALLEAHEAGMDIIIKEGLANGRALLNPTILEYSKRLGCEPDQLALACILAQPFCPRVLSGAVTPQQLSSNLKAKEVANKLIESNSLLKEIMTATCMDSDLYWSDRAALAWN
jgi:aryl-alcohol dehydrogenase-like predicted oxidoreductase